MRESREPYDTPLPPLKNSTFDIDTQTNTSDIERKGIKKDIYDIIFPNIKKEIEELLYEEKVLAKTANICEILKYVLLMSVPILALSAPQFTAYYALLSYLSGGVSIFAIGLERFAKVADIMSKAKSKKVKDILKGLNISYVKEDLSVINPIDNEPQSPRTK